MGTLLSILLGIIAVGIIAAAVGVSCLIWFLLLRSSFRGLWQ